ncbi:helix-turn-helix domain-containing protein [Nocardioides sp. P5_C9_2]
MGKQTETLSDYLTLAEVGDLLRLSRTTLWRMEKSGSLTVVRFGSAVRVPRSWVTGLSDSVGGVRG